MKTRLAGTQADKRLAFWCPGCEEVHMPRVAGVDPWTWNGDRDRPTLSPSILVTDGEGNRCHSYLESGRLRFLSDCTHALAGQMVDLPEFPEHFQV